MGRRGGRGALSAIVVGLWTCAYIARTAAATPVRRASRAAVERRLISGGGGGPRKRERASVRARVHSVSVRGDTRDSRPVRAVPPATRYTDAARVPVRGRAPTGSAANASRPAAAVAATTRRIRVAQGVSVLHHRITAPTVHDTLKYSGFRLDLPVHTRRFTHENTRSVHGARRGPRLRGYSSSRRGRHAARGCGRL
ncbi:hypothetical protein EVAR_103828_1 [Eumeta japonica]|uniref:Uncharacterized protein n=1 Tax=Eumeta variegata TaxID=151549 RepID=A0A4C1S9Y7_EUMVA|nr:hypothetical protein EVAR_103828_1 [Eumeta japonica]